jgi:hypothetical protein
VNTAINLTFRQNKPNLILVSGSVSLKKDILNSLDNIRGFDKKLG